MEYALIQVFTSETAQHGHGPVYTAVLNLVRRRHIAARVHVHRGIAGAYEGGEFSTINILDLSANLPVKIDIVLPAAQVDVLLAELEDVVSEGLVAVQRLDVRLHRSHRRLLPRDLRVADVMTPNPLSVGLDTPAAEIVRILMKHDFKGLPVVDGAAHVAGIVTEDDLIQRGGLPVRPGLLARLGADGDLADAAPAGLGRMAARQLMATPVVTTSPTALVQDVVQKMVRQSHRTLPVVDESGRLVGMISRLDILRAAGHWTRTLEQWHNVEMELGATGLVRDALSSQGRSVPPSATLAEVSQMIMASGIRRVAVVDEAGRLAGVVAESDLLAALAPERAGLWDLLVRRISRAQVRQRHPALHRRAQAETAADVMTADVIVAQDDEPLAAVIARMVEHRQKELPVVDAGGRFCGFLSRRELLRAMARPQGKDGTGEAGAADLPGSPAARQE